MTLTHFRRIPDTTSDLRLDVDARRCGIGQRNGAVLHEAHDYRCTTNRVRGW